MCLPDAAEAGDDAAGELAVLPADGAVHTAPLAVRSPRQSRLSSSAGRLVLARRVDKKYASHRRRTVGTAQIQRGDLWCLVLATK